MKLYHNDLVYNTSIDKALGKWTFDTDENDTYYYEETLYLKRGLRLYYLYGKGGSTSKYATEGKNGWQAGEAIIPLTDFGAEMWAKRKLGEKERERLFGKAVWK